MFELPSELAGAVSRLVFGSRDQLGTTTRRLIDRYQADTPAVPGQPIMSGATEALAYAAYRMPATYAAIRTVLDQLPDAVVRPGADHLDVAGGTGAAVWAVADRWPDVGSHTVVEQSAAAMAVGRRLISAAAGTADRTRWQHTVISHPVQFPAADVTTIGYLLSEIDENLRQDLLTAALDCTRQALIIIEPGTKNGYRRILDTREQAIKAGWHVVAPCPHDLTCPLQGSQGDWCHFSARLNRSSVHRRVKGADLGYEDEKFSYVVAVPEPVERGEGRVLRHPRFAKGRVELMVCEASGAAARVTLAKRDQDRYRAARKIEWGDRWPAGE